MKRPFLVWVAFTACALVGCGVLAWFTREMLRLDRESAEARRLAAVEENIRLALWRMDSALASIHGLEASRPVADYEPFYQANTAYAANLANLPAGSVLLPSPLLGYTPPFVRLHFQIEPDGLMRSPQAPAPELQAAALNAGLTNDQIHGATAVLNDLQTRLARFDFASTLPPAPLAPFNAHDLNAQEYRAKRFDWSLRRSEDGASAATTEIDKVAPVAKERAPSPQQIAAPRDEAVVQQLKSVAEQTERANTVDLSARYNAEIADQRNRVQAPVLLAEQAGSFGQSAPSDNEIAMQDRALPAPAAAAASPAPTGSPVNEAIAAARQSADGEANALEPEQQAAVITSTGSTEGPLQAVWAEGELVFARRASIEGRNVVQGAWLDWPELQAWLLSRVSDLLPQAQLVPKPSGTASTALDAARRLAFLPAQLVPGSVDFGRSTLASPLRISVGLAWAGALIGLGALALLLRGTLRLSERRGAFVSAVTHELRTPLTTFRMYTEMLASGMVTDEAKRRGYVDTLHKESERLSHLVENVLSYARLERGRAAARIEDTTPAALIGRIEDRLRQRAQQGGLCVRVEFDQGAGDVALRTDTTAVEQVLFNLVDNATKYGRPKNGGGEIVLRISRASGNRLDIRVSDQGPGLTAAARKRLFQPFSKSATEAAHTQPGVGLGLALCRRLARDELHGELVLERTSADGTVFRLELPLA